MQIAMVSLLVVHLGWTMFIIVKLRDLQNLVSSVRLNQLRLAHMVRDIATIVDQDGGQGWDTPLRTRMLTHMSELLEQIHQENVQT